MPAGGRPSPPSGRSLRAWAARALLSDRFVPWSSLACVAALAPVLPKRAASANLLNPLSNAWPLLVVSLGRTFVMSIGGIDFGQGAVIGLTSTLVAALIATAGPPEVLSKAPIWGPQPAEDGGILAGRFWAGIALILLAAALVGLASGALLAGLSMPPFLVTL